MNFKVVKFNDKYVPQRKNSSLMFLHDFGMQHIVRIVTATLEYDNYGNIQLKIEINSPYWIIFSSRFIFLLTNQSHMKKNIKNLENKIVVIWGAQTYYEENKDKFRNFAASFVFDTIKPKKQIPNYISDLGEININEKFFFLIAKWNEADITEAKTKLDSMGVEYDHLAFYLKSSINLRFMQIMKIDELTDEKNNTIRISNGDYKKTSVGFRGRDCKLEIDNISVDRSLSLIFSGSRSRVSIGSGTSFVETYIEINNDGQVSIGKDCMFSYEIGLYQSDQHLIFDKGTKKRINFPKNITVGNHVWIGRGAKILAGCSINDGSILGAYSVTAGHFGKNVIAAGNPAKVLRENILWSRDLIARSQTDFLSDCVDQAALLYI